MEKRYNVVDVSKYWGDHILAHNVTLGDAKSDKSHFDDRYGVDCEIQEIMRNDWMEYKPETFEYHGSWVKNWFSNMIPMTIIVDGIEWPSVENYFQAMKSINPTHVDYCKTCTPSQAKSAGRKCNLISNWEEKKESVMKKALEVKFAIPEQRKMLLDTNDEIIIEWNNWRDKYWGVTMDGKGLNRLGVLLMEVRDEILSQNS